MSNRNLSKLLKQLEETSESAKEWFWEESTKNLREDYEARGRLENQEGGTVYMFIGNREKVFYIGQTKQKIKNRQHVQTSKHHEQEWWEHWKEIRFLHVSNETDRITLELLLILELKPSENKKPARREIDKMFKT